MNLEQFCHGRRIFPVTSGGDVVLTYFVEVCSLDSWAIVKSGASFVVMTFTRPVLTLRTFIPKNGHTCPCACFCLFVEGETSGKYMLFSSCGPWLDSLWMTQCATIIHPSQGSGKSRPTVCVGFPALMLFVFYPCSFDDSFRP